MTHDHLDRVDHAEIQARIPHYVADALEIDERDVIAAHIAECATCQAEVEELRLLMRALAADHPKRVVADPSIADAVMEQIGSRTLGITNMAEHGRSMTSRISDRLHDSFRGDASFEWDRETAITVLPPSPGPKGSTRRSYQMEHHRQPQPVLAGIASLAVVASIAVLLLSHLTALSGIGGHLSAPGGMSTRTALAGNWRSAYLGDDARLHFVSASGGRSTSVVLPGAAYHNTPASLHVGISADGRYLAYIQVTEPDGSGPVRVVDLATGKLTVLDVMATEIHWAPDTAQFACGVFTGGATGSTPVTLVSLETGTAHVQELPLGSAASPFGIARIVGWIDATHLAVVEQTGRLALSLESLDLTTKQTSILALLNVPPDVFLSPDGKRVFIAPTFWNPVASVVDTETLSVRELPNITATFASRLQHLDNYNMAYGGNWAYQWAWQPNTHMIALSLSHSSIPNEGEAQPVTQQAGVWLIDVDHDRASNLTRDRYPLTWTPDGHTLLMSDIPTTSLTILGNTGYAVGPHLYAFSPVTSSGESWTLAGNMAVFFGLVHS